MHQFEFSKQHVNDKFTIVVRYSLIHNSIVMIFPLKIRIFSFKHSIILKLLLLFNHNHNLSSYGKPIR